MPKGRVPVHDKVVAATVGAACGEIIEWVLELSLKADVPTGVAMAIGVIATFVLGYFVPESKPATA